jgi:hypothetical protein
MPVGIEVAMQPVVRTRASRQSVCKTASERTALIADADGVAQFFGGVMLAAGGSASVSKYPQGGPDSDASTKEGELIMTSW